MPRKSKKSQRRVRPAPRKGKRIPGLSDWTVSELIEGGKSIAAAAASVMSGFNTEVKMYDTIAGFAAIPSAGQISDLSTMVQGNDYNQRAGNSIRANAIMIKVHVSGLAANFTAAARFLVFIDHEQRGAVPAVTDVLESAAPIAHINHNAHGRFQVLHDQYIETDTSQIVKGFHHMIPLGHHIAYRGAAAAAASAAEGTLYYLVISDQNNIMNHQYNMRLFYVDN